MKPEDLLQILHTAEKLKEHHPPLRHLWWTPGERGGAQLASGADGVPPAG